MSIFNNFDSYNLKARLYPALLTLLPIGITGILWLSEFITLINSVILLIATCGGLLVLASISRNLGKNIEAKLLAKWGA